MDFAYADTASPIGETPTKSLPAAAVTSWAAENARRTWGAEI